MNDSAISLQMQDQQMGLAKYGSMDSVKKVQIALLNRATKIDSNYFLGYWNKFPIQYALKQYANALATGKEMLRLKPKDTIVQFLVGKIYDQMGDTVIAKVYYKGYLIYCERKLDTMSRSSKQRSLVEFEKALVLILLNQPQKGHDILNKLYKQADDWDKDRYLVYMRLKRADMLKDTSITIGNSTTIINAFSP
ncbi:MAG: hypothetical protein ABI166_15940 [Mucilaginibacter sp.]